MSIKHQKVTLINNALQAHNELLWIEANSYKVKVQIVYIDTESEIKSAEKYVPLRDSVKNLLWTSCVDLVMGREDRVRESFEYSFKDGVATVFCELKPGSYLFLKRENFPKMRVFDEYVIKVYAVDTKQQQELNLIHTEQVQTKITKYFK